MKYLILAVLFLSGCAMSNDDVILETKKCEAAGMRAMPMRRLWSGRIAEVQCWPKLDELGEASITEGK